MAELGGGGDVPAKPATYRSLFASGEFRAMWIAQAISLTGDQLARVAITALVYTQTRSALITGLIYAVTYLPWLIGGPLLGGLADRYPRRTVMITCQLLSAVLVALMAVPRMPLWLLATLLFVVVLVESPFLSARASLLVDELRARLAELPRDRTIAVYCQVGQRGYLATRILRKAKEF